MKWFKDGDQTVITCDDFVNLHESPAVFVPEDHPISKTVRTQGVRFLPVGDLRFVREMLEDGGGCID